jgi:hypothetical protein
MLHFDLAGDGVGVEVVHVQFPFRRQLAAAVCVLETMVGAVQARFVDFAHRNRSSFEKFVTDRRPMCEARFT